MHDPTHPVPRVALAQAMKRQCRTTADLSLEVGIHPITLSRIRNGRQTPSPVTAMLLAEALGSTPEELGLTHREEVPA